MTDRDPSGSDDTDRDSLSRAFDENRESVESFVGRLDTVDELLSAALRSARARRGDAAAPADERQSADPGPTPDRVADADANPADDAARLVGAVDADGDDVAAAVETAAQLHREGALSGVTDAVSTADVARGVEAFLDAYEDPEVEGGVGYLVAVAAALGDDSAGRETEERRDGPSS